MATLKAPFNFVPLSDKVFFPDWADQISQDIPFSDGISGTIDLKITAESPIFIRNGHTREDKEVKNETYNSFSKTPDGRYFIPATSIKGCIRNVLEIMSFGKMIQVQNGNFYIRDLSNGSDGTFYRDKIKPDNIHCGWLANDNETYSIDDCGLPWRISIDEIEQKTGCGLEKFVKSNIFDKDENKTSKKKYDIFDEYGFDLEWNFSPDEDLKKALKVGNRQFVRFDDEGEPGTIVFTGQPSQRKIGTKKTKKGEPSWTGKYFEFVFPKQADVNKQKVDDSVIKTFKSIHKNSFDYDKFRKNQLSSGQRIPVFFMYDEDGHVDSIGLSYMYKYPTYNSVFSGIPQELLSAKPDLSECLFGYSQKDDSLKGRVSFSNVFASEVHECKPIALALSSPNPSYYPLYLGNGKTWNSEKVKIAGRKRYPARNTISNNKGTEAMTTTIKPLDKDSIFEGRINFFNLKPEEVGALLVAITFDGHPDCYHSIGSGKPLGYGKIRVDSKLNGTPNDDGSHYMALFESLIQTQLGISLKTDNTIKELLLMAKGIPDDRDNEFTYMKMDTNRNANEFLAAKDSYAQGEQLGLFSQIISNMVPKSSFSGNVASNLQRIDVEMEMEKTSQRLLFDSIVKDCKALYDNGKYDECVIHAKEAESLSFSFFDGNFEVMLKDANSNIDRRNRMERDQKQEQKRKEDEARILQQKINNGLVFLEEKFPSGEYKVKDIKGLVNRVNGWLKKSKNQTIPTRQILILERNLIRIYQSITKEKEKKEWLPEGKIWKSIQNIVDMDSYKTIVENFNKSQK